MQLTQKGARVLEGLAASGLRSIRYALEIDGISRIDANDLDGAVVEVLFCLLRGPHQVVTLVYQTCRHAGVPAASLPPASNTQNQAATSVVQQLGGGLCRR